MLQIFRSRAAEDGTRCSHGSSSAINLLTSAPVRPFSSGVFSHITSVVQSERFEHVQFFPTPSIVNRKIENRI